MTTHAMVLTLRPGRRGHHAEGSALHACLSVLRALGDVLAFSYGLRTAARGLRGAGSAAR